MWNKDNQDSGILASRAIVTKGLRNGQTLVATSVTDDELQKITELTYVLLACLKAWVTSSSSYKL
jgi:hypothetical protein